MTSGGSCGQSGLQGSCDGRENRGRSLAYVLDRVRPILLRAFVEHLGHP